MVELIEILEGDVLHLEVTAMFVVVFCFGITEWCLAVGLGNVFGCD